MTRKEKKIVDKLVPEIVWEHTITKHDMQNYDNRFEQFITSMFPLKHMAQFEEKSKKDKLYWDECGFSCIKKHMDSSSFKKTFAAQRWKKTTFLHKQGLRQNNFTQKTR